VLAAATADPELAALGAKALKSSLMPFAKVKSDAAAAAGAVVLQPKLPFDEAALLEENAAYLSRSLKVDALSVRSVSYEEQQAAGQAEVAAAVPGAPAALLTRE
jgi:leucyl-tRNA synthetase